MMISNWNKAFGCDVFYKFIQRFQTIWNGIEVDNALRDKCLGKQINKYATYPLLNNIPIFRYLKLEIS